MPTCPSLAIKPLQVPCNDEHQVGKLWLSTVKFLGRPSRESNRNLLFQQQAQYLLQLIGAKKLHLRSVLTVPLQVALEPLKTPSKHAKCFNVFITKWPIEVPTNATTSNLIVIKIAQKALKCNLCESHTSLNDRNGIVLALMQTATYLICMFKSFQMKTTYNRQLVQR